MNATLTNKELIRLLGLDKAPHVIEADIALRIGQPPTATVVCLLNGDHTQTVTQKFELHSVESNTLADPAAFDLDKLCALALDKVQREIHSQTHLHTQAMDRHSAAYRHTARKAGAA